jgi:phosphoglycerol transferase MdoB-like AlkP superfamily enzyme
MLLTRITLTAYSISLSQFEPTLTLILKVFIYGILNDFITFIYIASIFSILGLLIPPKIKTKYYYKSFAHYLYFIVILALNFNLIAEMIFWNEFATRYNFIAVDYLIYTTEVLGNIYESYPTKTILLFIFITSYIIYLISFKKIQKYLDKSYSFSSRMIQAGVTLALLFLFFTYVDQDTIRIEEENYANELCHNGIYNFFAAYRSNFLDYQALYKTLNTEEVFLNLKRLVKTDQEQFISTTKTSITRKISHNNPEKKYNIILISVESLSAEFLTKFGDTNNLTPYINKLIPKSLVFTHYYATGTRTVRGLEAMTLSVPPTPGNSLVRNQNQFAYFSLGTVLSKIGYDLKFLYGGYGYFDNMNEFYKNNHFETIDRSNLNSDEISFSNIWGVADEDLFRRVIKESDLSYKEGKPFFNFVMTTSNHRPYTYPEGKIDIASGTGREGAVKYTDYAIGQLIESAKQKPWFDNTLFVITADHCAGSAGKTDIPITKYHIPLIFYAPKFIKPKEINNLVSQIDLAPTLLGVIGADYETNFFGSDALSSNKNRALLGTYQKLGYLTPGHLIILAPKQEAKAYEITPDNVQLPSKVNENKLKEAISYYQGAYYLFKNGLMKE